MWEGIIKTAGGKGGGIERAAGEAIVRVAGDRVERAAGEKFVKEMSEEAKERLVLLYHQVYYNSV